MTWVRRARNTRRELRWRAPPRKSCWKPSPIPLIWFRLCGVLAMVAIVFASLMLPPNWEQMRTGHWFVEHFLGYFVASSIILLGWPKPLVVGIVLATTAVILEALQALSPNHTASALSIIGGVTGALTAAILAKLIALASRRRRHR